jgi:putative ABC transport system substrate-binding protein
MRRREFIALIGGIAVAWPVAGHAQQPAIPVIGYLSSGSLDSDAVRLTGLRRGLKEAGYIEGENVTIEYRTAGNQLDRLPVLAVDLVRHPVAVILACGLSAALAAKATTPNVPIVFGVGVDPVRVGLVASLSRPGENLTGISAFGPEFDAKGLEVLHELLPTVRSVGFLVDSRNPLSGSTTRSVLAAARAMDMQVQLLHASTESEVDAAFASLSQARTGALLVSYDYFLNSRSDQLVALAVRYAVPTVHVLREFALAGGLMSYGTGNAEVYRLAGLHVARILKGEKPADLPVLQISKIELVINMKVAKALGITVPPSLLARADELIE